MDVCFGPSLSSVCVFFGGRRLDVFAVVGSGGCAGRLFVGWMNLLVVVCRFRRRKWSLGFGVWVGSARGFSDYDRGGRCGDGGEIRIW